MSIFDELQTSLQEAVEIKQGKAQAKLHVSQAEFAEAMGTSVGTIENWETKHRNPTGLAAKVLATIQDNPEFFNGLASY
ncbi:MULTISPECIES: NadS family protein [unclassified Halomonas]|uniref:NadS family protein n=1 Tax=unclassified Halomonas TaxID=2609666 RepID=UPI0009903AE0|nr:MULTISPECIES: NadS family protein [unclassified Halomonas]AQU83262.1 transcriptional regulator [Halomonas sp. 'Soap Lake \